MSIINATVNKMCQSIRWAFNWKAWNPTEKEFAHAVSCVQLEEKERMGRFVFRHSVRASLIGRLMLRKFVNEYALIPYNEIVFSRDGRRKPILENSTANISFNVSHQGDYTVLAGEVKDIKLGVDIMKLEYRGKNLSEYFRTMGPTFSSKEWDEIKGRSSSKSEQVAMYYRHWALKESYVKALGVGIVMDLKSLDFKTNSELLENKVITDTVLYIDGIPQNWLFEESLLDAKHCVSVALQENNKIPQSIGKSFEIITSDDLLLNAVPLYSQDTLYTRKYFDKEEQPACWNYSVE